MSDQSRASTNLSLTVTHWSCPTARFVFSRPFLFHNGAHLMSSWPSRPLFRRMNPNPNLRFGVPAVRKFPAIPFRGVHQRVFEK